MPKLKGPLFSLEAHGSLAKTLGYSNKRTGQQVRKYNKPTGTASAKQRGQRRITEFLIAQWQNMSAGDKATWEATAKASNKNLPGYHYFLREAQHNLPLHHGLHGYWHCNEIVNSKILDISGNAYHGTLEPTPPGDAPKLTAGRSTRFSKALLYDGSNDYVTCSDVINFGVGDFSILFWVKAGGAMGNWGMICRGEGNDADKWEIHGYTGQPYINFTNNTKNLEIGNIDFANDTATWHMLALTADRDGAFNSYFDGKYYRTRDHSYFATFDGTANLLFGSRFWVGDFFKGTIDEISIYKRALSTAEIAARYKFATAPI